MLNTEGEVHLKLVSLAIENFRNLEEVKVKLTNQNVIFGMNDMGKTNLMFALRFLLDKEVRKNGFKESDYFKNNTDIVIKITLCVDLSDRETNDDSKHIISKVAGARTSDELNLFYFQVKGIYDKSELVGIPKIYWGNRLDNLLEVNQNGIFSSLDNLFKVVYVDPTIDLEKTFSKNRKKLFDQTKLTDNDIAISSEIKTLANDLNQKISGMEVIQNFQTTITKEYKKLKKEEINIEMKSELSVNGYFNNLIPYIKRDDDDNIYPTSGDGRKKILAYSLLNYLIQLQEGNKIIIYLIEEPENSLHRSMQIALSKQLFSSGVYNYFFLSTHSSELLYEMDNASLVRIYSQAGISCNSYIYQVDQEYKNVKKELNRSLASALFAEKVLLVEGPSERVLFEKVLEEVHPTYELDGGFLLDVNGIKFKPYVSVLRGLNIKVIVKTDNDLKSKRNQPHTYDLIGIQRCLNLLNDRTEEEVSSLEAVNIQWTPSTKKQMIEEKKLEIFKQYETDIDILNNNNIFLSKIDLEHDLFEAIGNRMNEVLGNDPIKYLQEHKLLNMIELTSQLTEDDCSRILRHEQFQALRKLVPDEANSGSSSQG